MAACQIVGVLAALCQSKKQLSWYCLHGLLVCLFVCDMCSVLHCLLLSLKCKLCFFSFPYRIMVLRKPLWMLYVVFNTCLNMRSLLGSFVIFFLISLEYLDFCLFFLMFSLCSAQFNKQRLHLCEDIWWI